MNIFNKLLWPLRKVNEEASEIVAEKTVVAVSAALGEVPMLASLLKGEEVTIEIKVKLKPSV
jgi:hypothetical protein